MDRLVVVHDELDLPYGALRLKRGGGDNGHNGLRSITRVARHRTTCGCGSASAGRRAGWTRPTACCGTSPAAERKELDFHLDRAADAVEALVLDGLEPAQNRFNI